ncbi:MAG: V-type ATP synthase subunit F [Aminipila sp.]
MYKIAVLGDYDSIYGFATLGLELFPVKDELEAKETLGKIVKSDYGIIYITENYAAMLSNDIEKYAEQVNPSIILIPGVAGNTGDGITGVKKSVEKAVGSDILFSQ